jgi:hypothetical protein
MNGLPSPYLSVLAMVDWSKPLPEIVLRNGVRTSFEKINFSNGEIRTSPTQNKVLLLLKKRERLKFSEILELFSNNWGVSGNYIGTIRQAL